jgi:ABC-2 type transport system ATP-binding protein
MTKPPISVKKVKKSFGEKTVLDGISIDIPSGGIFGLIGLNGVGKTTLIKILLGLLNQDSGETAIFGENIDLPKTRETFSYLPEKFQPSPYLKGEEFLSLTLSYYGKKLDIDAARAKARVLDLDPDVLSQKITHYSKGMTQKLGLLSALLTEAPLLILDEPMSGLDPRARIHLKDTLLEYVEGGNTIFFSSHILSDIDEICSDIAIIHNKNILFEGTPKSFKTKYKKENLERAFLLAIES